MAEPVATDTLRWGRSTVRTACPLDCPDSCSLDVTLERGRIVKIDGNHAAPSTAGYICGKVRQFDRRVYGPERLRHPAVRIGPKGRAKFKRVSWDEALDLVAERMREAREAFGAESVLPYYYGGSNGILTNELEDARLFRRFGASRLARTICAAPTGAASAAMYGKMAGVAYPDYEAARLIIVWGCNPSASGIHLVAHIKRAQKQGARLVVIDPRRTALARQADLHLALKPGTDLPVALAIVRDLFARDRADRAFLSAHATGADDLARAAAPWTIERTAAEAGLASRDLETLAEWYGTIAPSVIRCGWGQERNRNGTASTLAILALPAVAGRFGVRGGGYTMSNSSAWGVAAERLIDVPAPPSRIVNMNQLGRALTELRDPPVQVLFVYNCNPVSTVPDQNLVRRGLAREDLFTVLFEQAMTDTAPYADVLLPATTFLEHYDISKGYGAYHFHLTQPVIAPVGEARPNHDVFRALAVRLDLVPAVAPEDDLGDAGGLMETSARLPVGLSESILEGRAAAAPGEGHPVQCVDVHPQTADGKIHLCPASLGAPDTIYAYAPDPATARFPLSLISPASAHTISSTLGEFRPRMARVKIHPDDAGTRAITNGDPVRVFNDLGEVQCEAAVTPDVRPSTVSIPKGLWARSTYNGSTATALAPDTIERLSGGACFNDARVQVELLGRH